MRIVGDVVTVIPFLGPVERPITGGTKKRKDFSHLVNLVHVIFLTKLKNCGLFLDSMA